MQFSTDYHLQNYRELDTDELLRRVLVLHLTDEALAAVRIVLAERGVEGDRLELAIVDARRGILQSSSATNECDWCGRYTMLGKHWQGGQKFCGEKCARLSRLNAAALTLAPDVVLEHAHHLSAGACPMCKRVGELVEIRSRHTVVSFLLFASVHVEPRMSCRTCAVKEAWLSIAICGLFGVQPGHPARRRPVLQGAGASRRRSAALSTLVHEDVAVYGAWTRRFRWTHRARTVRQSDPGKSVVHSIDFVHAAWTMRESWTTTSILGTS